MSPRTYGDACGIPRALDRIGERWALMIVRELLLGPKRFTDLRTGLPHASPNVLSQRLRELEAFGVVQRRTLPPPAASRIYELTEWGQELEPVLSALGRWGARAPLSPPEVTMSLDSHLLSLRTLFDPALAEGFTATLELRLGEHRFSAAVSDGKLEITRGAAPEPDATIASDPATMLAVAHGRTEFSEARRAGDLVGEGDAGVAERFTGLFTLPQPFLSAA
ncbi:MAG TPA: winged helix-turn-helix transcriptional regulator [Thermoleophilaceae bacterium]|nr:winged helix-turn-helix transcriptional regulator [Thermoleophilaceae bacterium]